MRWAPLRPSLSLLALMAALSTSAEARPLVEHPSNQQIFAMNCAASIGFADISLCPSSPLCQLGTGTDLDQCSRKTGIFFPALFSNVLAGNPNAQLVIETLYAAGVSIPYVGLNADSCDRFLSDGGGSCHAIAGREPTPGYGGAVLPDGTVVEPTLNQVLTDEQEALLGCGPFWGTDCERDGIDLLNVESSVLVQRFPGVGSTPRLLPGARGPETPGYDPDTDGCVTPIEGGPCHERAQLVVPPGFGDASGTSFDSEMAALSWNLLMTLVAFSTEVASPSDDSLSPADPYRIGPGLCSFSQPQFCHAVIVFVPEPGPKLGALVALTALSAAHRRPARGRGKQAHS